MQVVSSRPNLFLRGLRAAGADAGPQGLDVEEVGVLVLRQSVSPAGAVGDEDPLVQDEGYGAGTPDPARLESDLSTTKPALDVVVVRGEADAGAAFGRAEVRRTGSAVVALDPLPYGWRPRKDDPRKGLAGADLAAFRAHGDNLPHHFRNAFFNGGFLTGPALLTEGDRVTFVQAGTGTARTVTVPPAPSLALTLDGAPLEAAPALEARVDTVALEWSSGTFHLTWRAVFPWEDRFEPAALEVA